jgi:DNA-binding transcriptional LysR family regulator
MALNNLDLNRLKCFQAVAANGSLLEGAKQLNITSSAVYQSVKKLEADLQKHLFFRAGKKYVLTDEGRKLQELFARFLWDVSQFQEATQATAGALEGDIRIGLPLNFSKSVFMPILAEFNKLHPRVSFHLMIGESRRLVEHISKFELDFAITDDAIPPELLPKIEKVEVFKEELVLVCSPGFYKKHEKTLRSLKKQRELPHLDYSRHLPLIQRWYKTHQQRQAKITQFHTIDNVETMVVALHEGLGLGIIPKVLLENTNLVVVPAQEKALFNTLFLVQESNYINNTLMKKFLAFLRQSL